VNFCTGNDDNFLGEEDGILACLGNGGGTRATPLVCLKDSFGSFFSVKNKRSLRRRRARSHSGRS
jgi:hypothetical protein